MTRVKICGLKRIQDAEAVNEAGADLAGVILSQGYRRSVCEEDALLIRNTLNKEIQLCGVFVNETEEYITSFIHKGVIDVIQLHGQEDNRMIDSLHEHLPGVTVMKAFTISDGSDLKQAADSHADMVLLDSGSGTGKTFNWGLINSFNRPYFLAGGLNENNISEAIHRLHPYGVDTSSGVETDHMKDPDRIKAFVKAVRTEEGR